MPLGTGDIIIYESGFGHVAMGYSDTEMIHANNSRNFHKVPWSSQGDNGVISYASQGGKVFKCPWDKCTDAPAKKLALQAVADKVMEHATYGLYRAFRLKFGSSIYGPDAQKRFQKYRDRQLAGYTDPSGKEKFISTITCAEAVIVSFQLAFADSAEPFFFRLDGAHTMPGTLATYLTKQWGAPVAG
jgi:hypothetical protein